MRILIITAWYKPFIHPRAHRWTEIAEQWAKNEHSVHVLTASNSDADTADESWPTVHRVGYDSLKEWAYSKFDIRQKRGRVGALPGQPGKAMLFLEWLYKKIWKQLYFPDDACLWYFSARKKAVQLLENEQFDAVVSVSLPFTGHLLGLAIKKRFPNLTWLADVGDPFSFQANPPNNRFLYGKMNLRLEKRVLQTADAVTVTTPATHQKYAAVFGPDACSRLSVIPPIFSNPIVAPVARKKNGDAIAIGYFGALYVPTRTPDAFLGFLHQLEQQKPHLAQRLEVHFYGDVFPEFYAKLADNPLVTLHGLCSRTDAWQAMQQMDVLLNIGNTTDFQLPSKAVDYLASGKPIVNFSYVESDPFAAFFEDKSLIINIPVINEAVNDRWIESFEDWLNQDWPTVDAQRLEQWIKPYSTVEIAAAYLQPILQATT